MKRLRNRWLAVLFLVVVAGCTTTTPLEEGRALIEQGQTEAGLQRLQTAAVTAPDNAIYRAAYLRAREQAVNAWMAEAFRATAMHHDDVAEDDYLKVLRYDYLNASAQAGLRDLSRRKAHRTSIDQATVSADKGDDQAAMSQLRQVLAEDNEALDARSLLKKLEERNAKPSYSAQLDEAFRRPISLEFRDATLRQVFEVLTRSSGLSFVFDKDVKTDQKVTVYLRETTVASAVQAVLLTNQLEQRALDGKTILIYPNTPAKVRDYQPLSVKSFFLSSSDAKTVANTLKTVLKSKDIVVDEKQNMIVIRDTPQAIKIAEKLVALHEMPEPEVMLDVEILEVQRSRLLALGVQYPSQISLTPLTDANGNITLQELKSLNSSAIGVTISPLNINANHTLSDANILANPRIRTRNHEKAKVQVGERLPNVTTTIASAGFASENIQYIDVGLKLEVEPDIYPDNEVGIKIALEVSSVLDQITTKSGSTAYEIGTRNATTVLRLRDGENQILAGLINDQESRSAQRLPGIGDVPLLGRLFGNQQDSTDRTEIVLSITPHLIRNLQRPSLSVGEFDSGTEGSVGASSSPAAPQDTARTPAVGAAPAAATSVADNKSSTSLGASTGTGGDTFGGSIGDPVSPAVPSIDPNGAGFGVGATGIAASGGITAAAGATTVAFTGATQVTVGSQLAVGITLQPGQAITSIPTTIQFDPKVFEVVGIAPGTFFSEGGQPGSFSSKVDPVNGLISIAATTGSSTGNSDAGTLLTITFQALAPSSGSQVQIQSLAPQAASGQAVSVTLPAADVIVVNS